jgi:hypothetical protein
MKTVGTFIRSLVRPVVTIALVGAAIFMATVLKVEQVQTAVVAMGGVALTFWFSDRASIKREDK